MNRNADIMATLKNAVRGMCVVYIQIRCVCVSALAYFATLSSSWGGGHVLFLPTIRVFGCKLSETWLCRVPGVGTGRFVHLPVRGIKQAGLQ